MKKASFKTLNFILFILVLFSACTKVSTEEPLQTTKQLQISLNEGYMPAAKVDSALAIWEVGGETQTITLHNVNNKLIADLATFNNGSGTLSVQLFTQTKVDNKPLQWEKRLAYTLDRATTISLSTPIDLKDPSWNPRVICRSEIYGAGFTVIIALRPDDPYFELKEVTPAVSDRIEIMRSFYQNDTTNLIASRGWVGTGANLDNKGNFADRDHFRILGNQLKGRAWNKYKIRASFYDMSPNEPCQNYEVEFEQNKP